MVDGWAVEEAIRTGGYVAMAVGAAGRRKEQDRVALQNVRDTGCIA